MLLLDEPFSALDASLRAQVRAEVARIVRDVGVTTVFVTHDQDEAFVLGDNVATVAATPIGIVTIDDRRTNPASNEVQVLVRPEQVNLRQNPTGGTEAATISTVQYYSHDVRYEIELADGTVLAARTHSTELYERGDAVYPSFQSRQRGSTSAAFSVDRTDA